MRKDLREARWLVAAYLAIVVLSTANALRWPATSNNLLDMSMLFVVGTGVFVAAALVQADSPTRIDAFWASRPFHPSAMLAAKLLLTAVVVAGAALLGQFEAITVLDLTGATIAGLLGQSAYAYAMWLIVSVVVAALTPDLRTFVLMLIVIPTVDAIAAATFSWFPTMSVTGRIALVIAATAGALVLLVALYRTRDMRRRTWVAGFVVVSCALYSVYGDVKSPGPIETPALPTRDIGLRLEVPDMTTMPERSNLHLVIRTEDPRTSERLTFIPEQVLIRLRDGKTLQLHGAGPVTLFTPKFPTTPSIHWLAPGDSAGSDGRRELVAWLTANDRRAMQGGVSSVVVEGTVIPHTPRILATLPLEKGASVARDGVRVEILAVGHGLTDTTVALRETSVQVGDHPALKSDFSDGGTLDFALLNASRGEARVLYKHQSPRRGGSLVLPGIDLHDETTQFKTIPRGEYSMSGPEGLDDAWMRGATLIIAEWVVHSQYAVRVETSVP